jgi:hypothetical protein
MAKKQLLDAAVLRNYSYSAQGSSQRGVERHQGRSERSPEEPQSRSECGVEHLHNRSECGVEHHSSSERGVEHSVLF